MKKYTGYFTDDKNPVDLLQGQGTHTYADGAQYVGEFKDHLEDGHGTVTYLDGGQYVGEWKGGARWEGTETDKDGNVIAMYFDGVVKDQHPKPKSPLGKLLSRLF